MSGHDYDIVILGAGGGGITSAFEAQRRGAKVALLEKYKICLLYTSPSPRDATLSRMPSSA